MHHFLKFVVFCSSTLISKDNSVQKEIQRLILAGNRT